MKRLTLADVEALPVGTRVFIKWSGGNGPYWYRIGADRFGNKIIRTDTDGVRVDFVGPTMCIGLKEPSTIVEIEE